MYLSINKHFTFQLQIFFYKYIIVFLYNNYLIFKAAIFAKTFI